MKKKSDGNPVWYLCKKMWQYSEGNRKKVILYVFLFIIVGILDILIEPMIWSHILNRIQKGEVTQQNVYEIVGLLGIILVNVIFFWALHGPARVLERNNAFKIRTNYREFLTKGTLDLPLLWHKTHHSGKTVDQMSKGTQALFSFSENSFEIIYGVLELIIGCSVLAYYFPWSLVLTLGMLAVSVWIISRFDKTLNTNNKILTRKENDISQIVIDVSGNMTTVITLRIAKLVFKSIMDKTREPFALFSSNNKVNELKWFITALLCNTMTITVLVGYILSNVETGILFGSIYLLQNYLRNISKLFSRFAGIYNKTMLQQIHVMNAEELTEQFNENPLVNHVLPATWSKLSIRGLSFSYTGSEHLQLDNVSASIRHGQKIAVVGRTGSGKSTFVNVMRDLQQPQALRLKVDEKFIEDGFAGIAQGIALIPQKPEIFASTVLENITLGVEYSDELIQEALAISCFEDTVLALKDGLETRLGEDGMTLSGGQQQRLALARGLLACIGKDIILADEPTSSLDAQTARKVFQGLIDKFRDKTVICIVHDLHMLELFDTIFVFDEGKLVGVGSRDQLLETCRAFQDLCGFEVALI